jgi:predicted HicB family RNase H-like nuclease
LPKSGKKIRFFVDALAAVYYIAAMKEAKTEKLNVRLTENVYRSLSKRAMDTERSMGWHVQKALEAYLRGQK